MCHVMLCSIYHLSLNTDTGGTGRRQRGRGHGRGQLSRGVNGPVTGDSAVTQDNPEGVIISSTGDETGARKKVRRE